MEKNLNEIFQSFFNQNQSHQRANTVALLFDNAKNAN